MSNPAQSCSSGTSEPVPLADHNEIGRKVIGLPWAIQSAIVTIAAHCTVIKDKSPAGDVSDLAGCISQDLLELANALSGDVAQGSRPRDFLAWAVKMFGPVAKLRSERLLRFVEEAIELAHAEGMERNILDLVANRVYSRPAGNVGKEIGQAQACLETFAENIGLSSADEAEREWHRVQEISQEEWTRRHSAKQALGIANRVTSTDREAGK